MSMSDPLGDMLTRIRNGVARRKSSVSTPASNLRARVLDVLQAEGYIRGYSKVDFENGKSELNIELKYYEGAPVIRKIDRVSKPGRRVYVSVKSIPQVANGLGITILSTPKGVMPITRLANRMLAANCSARSSDRADGFA
jgi:small subunit ribosomal protein S8